MKDQVFGVLQRIGRSFMLPIALLPVAGLLLGIGGSFSNTTMLETYGLTRIMGPGTFWNALFTVMSQAGDIVFANLPILFAMGIAIGMAKKEKEVAALAAVISFLVMHAAIGAMIAVNGGTDALKEGAGAMVAGIPNVGKSTFINSYAGKACAKTGNKPGVTRGAQWIKLNRQLELLDTPGILWPRFENQEVGFRLALIGSIRDEVLNTEEMAFTFLQFLRANYPGLLQQRYEIEESDDALENLNRIAENRLCRLKGNMLDLKKASDIVIDDFRSGRLGRITLEFPDGVGQEKD